MNCQNCNAKISEDDLFCQNCGCKVVIEAQNDVDENAKDVSEAAESVKEADNAETPKPAEPINEENSVPNDSSEAEAVVGTPDNASFFKRYGALAAVAVLVVIGIIVCFALMSDGGKGFTAVVTDSPYTVKKDDEALVFCGTKQIGKVDGLDGYIYKSLYSMDGSILSFIAGDSGDELYFATKSEVKKIAADVNDYEMAASGNAVAYISDDSLYLYNIKTAKNEKISNEADYFVISPDGKCIAYTDEDEKCHIYSSGKSSDVDGKEIYPVAISDNAKYFYYVKNDNLYVYTGNEDIKISNDIGGDYVIANNDCTEIIFYSGSNIYISEKGGDKQKLVSGSSYGFSVLLPESSRTVAVGACVYYPFDTFDKKVIQADSLRYIENKKEWSAEKITSSYYDAILSEDGKKLAYIKNDKIYLVNNLQKSLDGEEIADEAVSIYGNGSLSDIYFISEDDEFKYINNKDKSTKIGDDVVSALVSPSGDVFFTVEDTYSTSILYSCSDKSTKKKVDGGGSVRNLFSRNSDIFFIESDDDTFNYYILEKGDKFTCVVKDYDIW